MNHSCTFLQRSLLTACRLQEAASNQPAKDPHSGPRGPIARGTRFLVGGAKQGGQPHTPVLMPTLFDAARRRHRQSEGSRGWPEGPDPADGPEGPPDGSAAPRAERPRRRRPAANRWAQKTNADATTARPLLHTHQHTPGGQSCRSRRERTLRLESKGKIRPADHGDVCSAPGLQPLSSIWKRCG